MPIRWNALKVKEAIDMLEEFVSQAAEPLECAQTVAREAKNLPNLPQYIEQGINSILNELERVTGRDVTLTHYNPDTEEYSHPVEHSEGSIKRAIQRLREDIPAEAVKAVETREKYGSTPALV